MRSRNIKPSFFQNEQLVDLPYEARLMFIGLWTLSDREGRCEDRPKRIKMALFPADDVDAEKLLSMLASSGFIIRYAYDEVKYIQVINFKKHQNPHVNEKPSTIPAPDQHQSDRADSLIPDSPNPRKRNGASAPRDYPPEFESVWEIYPEREGDDPKNSAFHAWNARRNEGTSVDDLFQGTLRYAEYSRLKGNLGTEFVMQAKRFFGKNKPFLNSWKINGGPNAPRERADNSAPGRVRAANGIRR